MAGRELGADLAGAENDRPNSASPQLSRAAVQEITETEKGGVPLNTPWTLYLDKSIRGATAAEFEANLRNIYTVTTVQSFWSVYNNIPGISDLSPKYSYHLMRNSRRPIWEDDCNRHGGTWRLKCLKKDTAHVWKELLLACIGEQWSDSVREGDDIVGLSVSIKDRDDIVQIWNNRSDLAEGSQATSKVKELLPTVNFQAEFYKPHQTHHAYEGHRSVESHQGQQAPRQFSPAN
ncbi:PREDICTED: eukaryotic translation initiation factor 4E type 3-like [Priapulus caudatus]|uniref:Eukaryotic translation initiation factor 4E type 3-like n=1 Tax=Priapulus caudatus TaxID=37621 RepID=A0ABM1ES20_PRICU|nr:PREDICTED: eukaryotic translation initiation factor 4E type 3-like [Priapulus caudatus]